MGLFGWFCATRVVVLIYYGWWFCATTLVLLDWIELLSVKSAVENCIGWSRATIFFKAQLGIEQVEGFEFFDVADHRTPVNVEFFSYRFVGRDNSPRSLVFKWRLIAT